MRNIDNILVIVDPAATSHPAVDKGIMLAQRCNARLDLFACETRASRETRYAAHLERDSCDAFIVDLHAILDPLAQPARELGIDVCIDTDAGDPPHAMLIDRARRSCADLIVKDTHHHSLARRTFITNTDWHLIRCCKSPLLLTKSKPWAVRPAIVAALDPVQVNDKPEALDRLLLEYGKLLSQRLNGSLHAVHAYLPLLPADVAAPIPAMTTLLTTRMLEEMRRARREAMEPLLRAFAIDPGNVHLQMGVASEVLPRIAADIGLDIVVMGAISRSGMQRIIVGSTAERVLEQLSCDVLVVKPTDFTDCVPF